MTEERLKEKDRLEKQLDKLTKQEEKLSRRLHILGFQEIIENVEEQFKSDLNDGYTIVIEKGDEFDIKTKPKMYPLRHEVVFILPNEYLTKLMELLKLAADNEISK
jgi:hypothetical protein